MDREQRQHHSPLACPLREQARTQSCSETSAQLWSTSSPHCVPNTKHHNLFFARDEGSNVERRWPSDRGSQYVGSGPFVTVMSRTSRRGDRCRGFALRLATGILGQIRHDEEWAAGVDPAGRLQDRPRLAIRLVQLVVSAISVGLENPSVVGEMRLGMTLHSRSFECCERGSCA